MKFLLPIDIRNPSRRAANLVGCIGRGIEGKLEQVMILTVLAGRYLRGHVKNIDSRAERLMDSSLIQRLRDTYIKKEVIPILNEIKEKLMEFGIGDVAESIEDGDPVEKILEFANERGYTHIFMERRGIGEMQEFFLGSVTGALLHRELRASLYLIGKKLDENGACRIERCLIPLDGSHHSSLALKEAGLMLSRCAEGVKSIELLHVINIARYPERVDNGRIPEKEGEGFLKKGKEVLMAAGIDDACITTHIEYGDPAKNIVEHIDSRDIDLVFMGRRGRSAIQELFIGSVSSEVIHRCYRPTFALITE